MDNLTFSLELFTPGKMLWLAITIFIVLGGVLLFFLIKLFIPIMREGNGEFRKRRAIRAEKRRKLEEKEEAEEIAELNTHTDDNDTV